jgi:predicted phage tail protein
MKRKIILYGSLSPTTEPFTVTREGIDDFTDLVSALTIDVPDFKKNWLSASERLIIVSDADKSNPRPCNVSDVMVTFGNGSEIHLLPSASGSGVEIAAAILDVAVTELSAVVLGFVINTMISLAIGALFQALSPSQDSSKTKEHDVNQDPSYLYNGPKNATEQGNPVPIVFGTHMTGSIVLSAGITDEQLLNNPVLASLPAGDTSGYATLPPAVSWQWDGTPDYGG